MQFLSYRSDIDALRGISVLLVVVFHAFPEIIPGGYIGVDVFFVISGFLITSIIVTSLQQSSFSLAEFYARRIRRLFPALITVLLVALLLGWLVLFPDELKQLAYHIKYSAVYWLNFILIGETGYFDVESIYKPLLHLWTLSVEEQYYLVWPVLLLLVHKQTALNPLYVIMAIGLLSFAANIFFIENHPENVYYNTLTRVWQLAAGSAIGIRLQGHKLTERKYLLYLGAALILVSALVINSTFRYPGWWAVLPTLGAMLFLAANVSLPSWGGLVQLGLISYPLYLWHWVVLSFLQIYLGSTPGWYWLVTALLVAVLLATVTYRYIEKIRYAGGRYLPHGLFSALIALGLLGAYIEKADGLPDRAQLDYLQARDIQFERTPMTDATCESYAGERLVEDRLFDYCRAENLDRAEIVAVIGDSHAHVVYPGITELAQRRNLGVILLANSSCPPFIGFPWGRNPKESSECITKIEQILTLVANEKRVRLVLMTTRGPTYIHGDPKGSFTRENIAANLLESRQANLTYQAFDQGLEKTLERLVEMPHIERISYLLENPELDFLPKEIVRRPFDSWGISIRDSVVERDTYLLRMQRYREIIARHGSRQEQFRVIDPAPYFCENDRCFSQVKGKFLYADRDHFSVFGARYLAELIEGQIFDD